mgnify:FL=1|jgi:hypothetical protein
MKKFEKILTGVAVVSLIGAAVCLAVTKRGAK